MSKGRLNVHIYPTPFKFESRILKETKSIIDLGLAEEVIILAIGVRGQKKNEKLHPAIAVRRFGSWSAVIPAVRISVALKYLEFYTRALLWMCLRKRISIVNCHSLMVLPLGALVKKFRRHVRLIYDAHELETERNGLGDASKRFSKFLEKHLINKCDSVIVVGRKIKEWYVQEYNLKNVFVVQNTPKYVDISPVKSDILRRQFEIPADKLIFIYQGILIPGRGLGILLNVFRKLTHDYHLIIMGYGSMEPVIRLWAKENANIHFHEAVAPHEIMNYTSSCDVGISLIENTSLSYYYSLPNKVFEYLHAGLPVIVSAFPEMENIVRSYHAGWAVNPTEEQLLSLIQKISREEIRNMQPGILAASRILTWTNEELQLKKAFSK